MNPVDHPHGGGRVESWWRHLASPWGVPTKGYKTRKNKRTNDLIVRRRKQKQRGIKRPRSLKKGSFIDLHLMKKVEVAMKKNEKRPIKTWSRRSMVSPDMVGLTIASLMVVSTFRFLSLKSMVGHKLESFPLRELTKGMWR